MSTQTKPLVQHRQYQRNPLNTILSQTDSVRMYRMYRNRISIAEESVFVLNSSRKGPINICPKVDRS
jgi:hypothetical protein